MLQVWQQFSGINTAMYYGPQMMLQAGFGDENDKDTVQLNYLLSIQTILTV